MYKQKSRIRETKHLSTDADSSTDSIGGWTKNTKKTIFLKDGKNHQKRKNSKQSRNMPELAIRHTDPWLSQGAWWSAYRFIHFC